MRVFIKLKAAAAAIVWLVCASAPTAAGELTGYFSAETRAFTHDALYSNQSDNNSSASVELEFYHDWDDDRQRLVATGFTRWDSADDERSHSDIREFYWWKSFDDFELNIGARKVFWGVAETVHLVDIINQDDQVDNLDGEDKLGQPMVSVLVERGWGTLEVFGLLGFRERSFVGEGGRLRGPLLVDVDDARYQSGAGDKHIDVALRWSQVIGDWDVGVSHFDGTSRAPLLLIRETNGDELPQAYIQPYYQQIQHTGFDLQATLGDWMWKLEAISVKEKGSDRNSAFVGGFEYTSVGIAESAADLGWIVEYQFDDRRGVRETANQNDLALGFRLTLNDMQSTELLAAMSVDLDNHSRFLSLEASRRLTDHWALEAELRMFSEMAEDDPGFVLRDDDYLQLELRRYF